MIEKLKECRNNPRKLRLSYLREHGLLSFIESKTDDPSFHKFKMKDKIDFILTGCLDQFCYCGNRVKPNNKYCSPKCTAQSPETKKKLSVIQKNNGKERYEKTKKTWLEKYGVEHNLSDPVIQKKVKAKRLKWEDKNYRETFERYGIDYDKYNDANFVKKITEECVSIEHLRNQYFGDMPKMTLYRFLLRTIGSVPYKKSSSAGEQEVLEYVRSLVSTDILTNTRSIITNRELDIYIPEYKLAIEYNGLYWHSGLKGKKSHTEKYKKCNDNSIQLLQFFDNEWEYQTDIVKSIIASKLDKTKRIFARKCVVKNVDKEESREFLENNHLQGYIAGTSFGLYYNDELVSLFVIGPTRFGNKDGDFELLRYASKNFVTVVGGFSKLLSHFKKTYGESMVTYCDLRYSDGKTYSKFGKFIRRTSPSYFWWNKKIILSRYKTQKHKLKDILSEFDSSKTEQENMINNGFVQIWDVGNSVYIL